jgi:type II secretory pathway pseudopilin PulG
MKNVLAWWYAHALPKHPPELTPMGREQERYARLTASLLLLFICAILPLVPIMLFFSPTSPSARPVAISIVCLLTISWISGRAKRQRLSAACIIACTFLAVAGPLLTDPLGPTLVPLFGVFTISIVLAGSLMPPVAALITCLISCLSIILVALRSLNLDTYNQGSQAHYLAINTLAIAILLPIVIQVIVAVIVYAIMRNLLAAIRRADRAEEIVALQKAVAEHERERFREQKQLQDGLEKIAEAHARIANGEYHARVSLNEGDVLWSIAIPLNNLLNRLQSWKNDVDTLLDTRQAAGYIAEQMRLNWQSRQWRNLPLTKTPLDPVIVEVNKMVASQQSRASRPLSW